jgi:hypothetical protein
MKFKSSAEREKWMELLRLGKITKKQFDARETGDELPSRVLGKVKKVRVI